RLRCLPRPAASSISRRRSFGLEVTIASTRPWEMTEWVSLPSPVSESTSSTSVSLLRAPFRRYPPSPPRSRRRTIEISESGRSTVPSELSRTISTSAALRACTPRPPPKITSCIDCPRTASGDCSPIAHSTASVTLDLPEPFGPTTTLTPSPKSRRVRSGNDLKPFSVSDLSLIGPPIRPSSSLPAQLLDRHPRGLLLGVLLAASLPAADLLAVDQRDHRVDPLVRRAVLARHLVADLRAAPRQQLLQRRLEVDGVGERVLDLRGERLDDRFGGPLVAGVQIASPDHRLDHRGKHPLGFDQRRRVLPHARRRRRAQPLGQRQPLGHGPAGDARDRLGADLRQPPGPEPLGR